MEVKAIDVDLVVGESTPLIMVAPSGIFYTVQCGGISCNHPMVEGFVLDLGNFAQDFDSCRYGCYTIASRPDVQMKLAQDFDAYCNEKIKHPRISIRFDFERVSETQEGWFPVIVSGVFDDFHGLSFDKDRGYIFNGNCD